MYKRQAYKLDIAVRLPEQEAYVLGIECEGAYFFSGESVKERQIYREQLLASRGWNFHRVWARNFWLNREKEVEKVLAKLEKM